MSFLQISSSRLGRDPDCRICGAGSTVSFNWEYAKTTNRSTEDVARGAAAWQRNECGKILDKAEYDRCVRRTEPAR